MEIIKIDLEGRDKGAAFFALYAGLRMYSESKGDEHKGKNTMSIAGAEAHSMLMDLGVDHPIEYQEAKEEYDKIYSNI